MNAIVKQTMNADILSKWQKKVDLLKDVTGVSAALIMKLHPHELEVFVGSANKENPFQTGDRGELNIGSYCDSVIASKEKTEIEDAAESDYWKEKVSYNNGMRSYLGLPILYPNQELFGTLCLLNRESRTFEGLDHKLFDHFRESIESDLLINEQNEIIRNTSIY